MIHTKLKDNSKINGTSLQGYVKTKYSVLCDIFGPADAPIDDFKSDAGWNIEFKHLGAKVVATIYNWKNGKNYCGEDGLDVEDITEWNIGGKDRRAAELVNQAVAEYYTHA